MNKITIRGLVFSALFAAVMMALSFLKFTLPFSTVPISFINFGAMLAGSILGARYGFLAILIALALAATGMPVIGGRGGTSLFLGATGGFIWVLPIASFCIGYFAQRIQQGKSAIVKLTIVNFLFGSLLLYPTGVYWLAHVMKFSISKGIAVGMLPYLPGDFIKALICAAVAVAVARVYPIERIAGKTASL